MEHQKKTAIQRQQNQLEILTLVELPISSKKSIELYFTTKKIRDYNEENLKALYTMLLAICKLIGVTEAPEQQVILLLIEHLKEHHSDFSSEEIKRAFSLATAGKLGFDFQHYNRLTPQLLSQTLNSYKTSLNKDLIRYKREESKMLESIESKNNEIDEESLLKSRIECTLTMLDQYKNQKSSDNVLIPVYDFGNVVYRFLTSLKIIDISSTQKEALVQRGREKALNKAISKGINHAKLLVSKEEKGDNYSIINEAKQLAVTDYFDKVISQDIDLKQLINSKLSKK